MKLGVCADPKDAPALADAGFEFIELHVQNHLKTGESGEAFVDALARITAAPIPALAANCFVPSSLKITGPEVDLDALRAYVEVAFDRAERAGIRTIVFGSGGARRIPEGFDRDEAWTQLVTFGQLIGPRAEDHGVTVVVEPLNETLGACNVLTSVGECGRYVEAVDHPYVRLLVDSYHWSLDGDSWDDIVQYGSLLKHVHIATTDSRVPPGFEVCDFSEFFDALGEAGYEGPISIEAKWEDMPAQAPEAFDTLQRLTQSM
jgi:sugar phosphate isomerase/epimerase